MKNDILSKLLAKERIKVVRKTVETASFDITDRILTLPAWKNISDSLELMLICHEVGHALYTTEDIVDEFCGLLGVQKTKLKKSQFTYLNVVEDVRIEQLIVIKYPGVKKHFQEGYVEFVEDFNAFKGAEKMTLDSLLIDRINVHCKVSNLFTVPFTDVELEILGRVQANESKLAVAALAKEIYDYDKVRTNQKKKEEPKQEPEEGSEEHQQQVPGSGDGDVEEDDNEPEEGSDDEDGEGEDEKPEEEELELEPEPETGLEEHDPNIPQKANVSTAFMVKDDFLIPWQAFSRENAKHVTHVNSINGGMKYLKEWRELNMPAVNYLVKEFNMRAAAASMKSIHEHQTGILNTRKLATHQLDKRIFLTKEIVEEGQSHGVIVAVDYSGSMEGMIGKVMRQALMVAEFCKKTQIPFSVFLYTTGSNPLRATLGAGESSTSRMHSQEYVEGACARGFEVLSSQMPKADYERAARLMMWRKCWSSSITIKGEEFSFEKMSGTPTINAMLSLYSQVDIMKRKANVDKVGVFIMTDGEADCTRYSQIYMPDGRMIDMEDDEVSYSNRHSFQLNSVYEIMKDRFGDSVHVSCIRLGHKHAGGNSKYDFIKFMKNYEEGFNNGMDMESEEFKAIWKKLWEETTYECKKPYCADSWIYAMVDNVSEISMADLSVKGKTSKSVAKEFSKKMEKGILERNLLNFIVNAIK